MSKTPRVDAIVNDYEHLPLTANHRIWPLARQLEAELAAKDKQLAEARAEIEKATTTETERWAERLNWLHTKHGADCSGTDSADLLDCVEDEIKQVINKQSELIEQMREALKFSLIADEVRQTRNVCASDINDACETSRIKRIAALLAAERVLK